MGHCAETAVACAAGTHNQKSRSMPGKAFPEIGAPGFLADGMEPAFFEHGPDFFIVCSSWKASSEPAGFGNPCFCFSVLNHYAFKFISLCGAFQKILQLRQVYIYKLNPENRLDMILNGLVNLIHGYTM